MSTERIVIVGPPRAGKSTLARELRANGIPTRCGDPRSKVKEPETGVVYLPEGIPISGDEGAAQWVCDNWLGRPGPWCCEGWVMARALRRYVQSGREAGAAAGQRGLVSMPMPCDRIVVLLEQHQHAITAPGQLAMGKAVRTVWEQVAHHFQAISEYR